jgi:hypothetical protein
MLIEHKKRTKMKGFPRKEGKKKQEMEAGQSFQKKSHYMSKPHT